MAKKKTRGDRKARDVDKARSTKSTKNVAQVVTNYDVKDLMMYDSAKKSLALAIAFFAGAVWAAGAFYPFDLLYEANRTAGEIVAGGLSSAFLIFLLFALGNALEIRGNVLEWKYIFVVLGAGVLVAAWGGMLSFLICISAALGILGYMWLVHEKS